MQDGVKMSVTQVFQKDGKKYAFVSFSEEGKQAEGRIPECRIMSRKGYSDEEVGQLESYMRKEIDAIWQMARGVNVMDAFLNG